MLITFSACTPRSRPRTTTWTPSTRATASCLSARTSPRPAWTPAWGSLDRLRKRSARWATRWRLVPWPSAQVRERLWRSATPAITTGLILVTSHNCSTETKDEMIAGVWCLKAFTLSKHQLCLWGGCSFLDHIFQPVTCSICHCKKIKVYSYAVFCALLLFGAMKPFPAAVKHNLTVSDWNVVWKC